MEDLTSVTFSKWGQGKRWATSTRGRARRRGSSKQFGALKAIGCHKDTEWENTKNKAGEKMTLWDFSSQLYPHNACHCTSLQLKFKSITIVMLPGNHPVDCPSLCTVIGCPPWFCWWSQLSDKPVHPTIYQRWKVFDRILHLQLYNHIIEWQPFLFLFLKVHPCADMTLDSSINTSVK